MEAYPECQGCQTPLTGRARKWCSGRCREAHRPGRQRVGRVRTPKPPKPFIGVDGESIDGRYVMLAAASDDGYEAVVENPEGLSTEACLRFLSDLPDARIWGFAFGYDVNMLLGDVSVARVADLYERGFMYWKRYRVQYVPGKMLRVTRYDRYGKGRKRVAGSTVWDMFTWIQTSFATWIEAWQLAPENEIARIKSMKAKRSVFDARHRRQIKAYCLAECRYLAAGARRMTDLIDAAGVNVKGQYYSPASVSKALMTAHDVVAYRDHGPEDLHSAIDGAYMGGRAEVSHIGPVGGPFYQYDIRSAYPAAAIDMPCLAHGHWHEGGEVEPWSLVRVSWRPLKGKPAPTWGALPVRPRTGSLRWPTHGTGWFWGVEVLAAMRHCTVEVKDVRTFRPGCDHRPFAYLQSLYDERRRRKDAGDPSEFVLKLALNATYGALAEHPVRDNTEPKYRCMIWAGWITAATRAKLLDALTDDVVLMATDCLMSRTELPLELGDGLGQWEVKRYDELWIAGTGIYYGRVGNDWTTTKTRGFESGQLSREAFDALWTADGRVGKVRLSRQRFIGMGVALHRINGFFPPQARLWRTFIEEQVDKSLDVFPRRAWVTDDVYDGRSVAPTLAMHKATEREDRQRIVRLQAQYDERARRAEALGRTIARKADRGQKAGFTGFALERTLREMVQLDNMLTSARREGSSVFDWSTDPQDNG